MNEIETKRRLARRRFAWISFILLVSITSLIMLGIVIHPNRGEIAEALHTASSVVISLISAFNIIIIGYLGVSLYEAVKRNSHDV